MDKKTGRRARGRSGGRHCTAGQYGYVPSGDTLFVHHNTTMIVDSSTTHFSH